MGNIVTITYSNKSEYNISNCVVMEDLKLVVKINVIFKLKPLIFNTHVIRQTLTFLCQSVYSWPAPWMHVVRLVASLSKWQLHAKVWLPVWAKPGKIHDNITCLFLKHFSIYFHSICLHLYIIFPFL